MQGLCLSVESVVAIGGLSHTDVGGEGCYCFFELNYRVGLDDLAVGVFSFKLFDADFNVEFTTTSYYVVTRLISRDLD